MAGILLAAAAISMIGEGQDSQQQDILLIIRVREHIGAARPRIIGERDGVPPIMVLSQQWEWF